MSQPLRSPRLVLYDYELDADCYKVRLLLALVGASYERVAVDVHPGHEERSPAYLALNPRGSLPILEQDGLVLAEAEAILLHCAGLLPGGGALVPESAADHARMLSWLFFARGPLAAAGLARLHAMLEAPGDGPALERQALAAFRVMEDHMTAQRLAGSDWFVGAAPSLADIALFPAIALSRDFGVDHDAYPALRRWMRRLRALPGFVTMPGIPDYH